MDRYNRCEVLGVTLERSFEAYEGDEPYVFVCYSHDDKALVYPELTRHRKDAPRASLPRQSESLNGRESAWQALAAENLVTRPGQLKRDGLLDERAPTPEENAR